MYTLVYILEQYVVQPYYPLLKTVDSEILKVLSMFCFRLYNKDAIIEYLLDKSAERPNAEAVAHIRGIKVPSLKCCHMHLHLKRDWSLGNCVWTHFCVYMY